MNTNNKIKEESKLFFSERGDEISTNPSLEDLCYVSGRDPRLWADQTLYYDMINSIKEQLNISKNHELLEVGCAAGFLARGIAPLILNYTGIDIADGTIAIAKKLEILNASFLIEDATKMKFKDKSFDRVISYDVFTNFPNFEFAELILNEIVRVTKENGKIMIGSIPDHDKEKYFPIMVQKVSEKLNKVQLVNSAEQNKKMTFLSKIKKYYNRKIKKCNAAITCFFFKKEDFIKFGNKKNLNTKIFNIHEKNPYLGYRFNVVYTKKC